MKTTTLFVNGLLVVGTGHYSGALQVQAGYRIEPEPGNRFDPEAIRVADRSTNRTVGHIAKIQGNVLHKTMSKYNVDSGVIRVKEGPLVRSRRQGPSQLANAAFKVNKDSIEDAKNDLRSNGLKAF